MFISFECPAFSGLLYFRNLFCNCRFDFVMKEKLESGRSRESGGKKSCVVLFFLLIKFVKENVLTVYCTSLNQVSSRMIIENFLMILSRRPLLINFILYFLFVHLYIYFFFFE